MEKPFFSLTVFHHVESEDLHRLVLAIESIAHSLSAAHGIDRATETLKNGREELEEAIRKATPSDQT